MSEVNENKANQSKSNQIRANKMLEFIEELNPVYCSSIKRQCYYSFFFKKQSNLILILFSIIPFLHLAIC
jgi:hypothetical protein